MIEIGNNGGTVLLLSSSVFFAILIIASQSSPKSSEFILGQVTDPQVSVVQKELISTEKAEEEAQHELREAEDQVNRSCWFRP